MATSFKFPGKKGAVYWPVGTGDSTTLSVIPGDIYVQIDLHQLDKAQDPSEPEWCVVDELVRLLPKKDGRPYLAAFVLTHPDEDHIKGFAKLLRNVQIGEIWHTPRIFRDQRDQESLCDDAKIFRREAHRRRKVVSDSPSRVASGDRIRVIGHDDILLEPDYVNLPDACKSRPAEIVESIDGRDLAGHFQAFIHAPFKEDQAKNRNNTSLSMNVVLFDGKAYGQFMFYGDREYPTSKRIFEITEERGKFRAYLYWDVMLCSHHCSKGVMFWQDAGDAAVEYKKDIMEYFEKYKRPETGYVVSSSHSKFTDGPGDNPPHLKARIRYEAIVQPGKFICTHEYPAKSDPRPIVFTLDEGGVKLLDERSPSSDPLGLAGFVLGSRPGEKPPSAQVGFGRSK